MVETSIGLVWNETEAWILEFWEILGEINVESDISKGGDVIDVVFEGGVGTVVGTVVGTIFDIVFGTVVFLVVDRVGDVSISKNSVCAAVSSFGVFRNLVGEAETSAESADAGDVIIFVVVDVGNVLVDDIVVDDFNRGTVCDVIGVVIKDSVGLADKVSTSTDDDDNVFVIVDDLENDEVDNVVDSVDVDDIVDDDSVVDDAEEDDNVNGSDDDLVLCSVSNDDDSAEIVFGCVYGTDESSDDEGVFSDDEGSDVIWLGDDVILVADAVIDSVAVEEPCVDDFDVALSKVEWNIFFVTEVNVSDAGNVNVEVGVGTTVAEAVSLAVTVPASKEPVVSLAMNWEVSCVGISGSLFSVK